jgi:hypothetical protein
MLSKITIIIKLKDTCMASRHLNRHPTSLVINEMQIKTTIGYHTQQLECLKLRQLRIPRVEEGVW